jgi:LysM repeat protein
MKISKNTILLAGLVLIISLSAFSLPANDNDPTGYDLAAAVNAYRAANGYYQINPNSLVMSAAQGHADWIVETGQGGHTGAGGSDETVRVSWTGYGGGAEIQCDEIWAMTSSVNDAIYNSWTDWTHQEVMLNAWGNRYTDIGGGVASSGNGLYVFVLDVCLVVGQEASGEAPDSSGSVPVATADALATTDLSNYIYGVTTATPLADGTIKHTVLYGQTLITIAEAYGITIDQLRQLNDMAADDSTIWVDQELVVRKGTSEPAAQETPTAEINANPTPGTAAPIETQTPPPTQAATRTIFTATPQATRAAPNEGQFKRRLGILLVVVSGGGLAAYLYFSSKIK